VTTEKPPGLEDWDDQHHCENEHPEPRPAVAVIHIIGSDSAANATSLCAECLVNFTEEWADEVQCFDPEAYRWEIRPVLPPDPCPSHTAQQGPHHNEACHYWDEEPQPFNVHLRLTLDDGATTSVAIVEVEYKISVGDLVAAPEDVIAGAHPPIWKITEIGPVGAVAVPA
jgi:hypothetical protein